jgi:hypothetical protein
MTSFFIVAAACCAVVCGPIPAAKPQNPPSAPANDPLEEAVRFPDCGLTIRRPRGMVRATRFEGFGDEAATASVMALRIEGPFDSVAAGFTAESMRKAGLTFVSREKSRVGRYDGAVVRFRQTAEGVEFAKSTLVFGDAAATWIVTATAPAAVERDFAARFDAAFKSVGTTAPPSKDAASARTFDLTPHAALKEAEGIGGGRVFTKDGAFPIKNPSDPLFVAGASFGQAPEGPSRDFAERRLAAQPHLKAPRIRNTEPVTVDGLAGFETVADATDATSGGAAVVLQLMLFEPGGYFLLTGTVGGAQEGVYLPAFRALARSFVRRPSPADAGEKPASAESRSASKPTSGAAEASAGDWTTFSGCGLRLRRPQGFAIADGLEGFVDRDSRAVLHAERLDAPFRTAAATFDAQRAASKGWTEFSSEDSLVGEFDALLVRYTRTLRGVRYLRTAVVFGDARDAWSVTISIPEARRQDVEPRLLAAMRTVELDPQEAESRRRPRFTAEAPPFREAARAPGMLTFTSDGSAPSATHERPTLTVTSKAKRDDDPTASGVERRVSTRPGLKDVVVRATTSKSVGSRGGFFAVADAKRASDGRTLVVFLFEFAGNDGSFEIFGAAGSDQEAPLREAFDAAVKTFAVRR